MRKGLYRGKQILLRIGENPFFGYGSLLLLELKTLWGAWAYWDLPLWDGSVYFIYANRVITSFLFPPLEWSPFFAGYYALFHLLFSSAGPSAIYIAHRLATLLLVVSLLYALLKAVLRPWTAWLITAYFICLPISPTNHFVVHLFVLIPLLAVWRASLSDSAFHQTGLTLACLLLTVFVRFEFILALGFLILIYLFKRIRTGLAWPWAKGAWKSALAPCWITFLILGLLLIRTGASLSSDDRFWSAFRQHYAWGFQERHPEWERDFWLQWPVVVQASFGEAKGLSEALRRNPQALGEHLWWNIRKVPAAFSEILTPSPPFSLVQYLIWLGICLALVGMAFKKKGLRPLRSEPPHLLTSRGNPLWWVVLGCSLPVLASSLIIRPRTIYLLPLLPILLLVSGLGWETLLKKPFLKKAPEWTLPILWVAFLYLWPAMIPPTENRPVKEVVASLKKIKIQGSFGLLAESAKAFCIYSYPGTCRPLEIPQVPKEIISYEQFLGERQIGVILINDRLKKNLPIPARSFVEKLQTDAESFGWKLWEKTGAFEIYLSPKIFTGFTK